MGQFAGNSSTQETPLSTLRCWYMSKISTSALQKHRERGKWTAEERLLALFDKDAEVLDVAPLAGMHETFPSHLFVWIGKIASKHVLAIANNPLVKGGTYGPLAIKKHLRALHLAQTLRLPAVYLVESGGAFLPLQAEVFPDRFDFGRIFFEQARMGALGLPQLAIVFGACTAGGAYVPAMADETIMVRGQSSIFLAGPPLVQAATGEVTDAETLGGADTHTTHSGLAEYAVDTEQEALLLARTLIHHWPTIPRAFDLDGSLEAAQPPSLLSKPLPSSLKQPLPILDLLACIFDANWQAFKPDYGQTLHCLFARLFGQEVGILANDGVLFSESADKGTHFIELCSVRKIPIFFFQNIMGFMVGVQAERGGIAKAGARLVRAVATATGPKFTLIIGGSFGAGNYGMCGRAYDPLFLWMWPRARIAVMGGEQADHVLQTLGKETDLKSKFEQESLSIYSSAQLWDDGLLEPHETRKTLGLALSLVPQTLTHSLARGPSRY
jgi:3-methylcrotonyl-CoA carboxylase beta subunit